MFQLHPRATRKTTLFMNPQERRARRRGVRWSCNTRFAVLVVIVCAVMLLLSLNKSHVMRKIGVWDPDLFHSLDPSGSGCVHVLVTGGAGFLGSHLCEELLRQGACVVVVDDLSSGSLKNVELLLDNPRFKLVTADVRQSFQLNSVHQIYHLASPASPAYYDGARIRTSTTNYIGTLHLLELATAQGARLLFSSTSEIYGEPEQHPQSESYWGNTNSVGPRSCYHQSKRAAEQLCSDFEHERGTQVRIARLFNTYGPRMAEDDGRVVTNFLQQAEAGQNITIYGDGSQTRSLCYVEDMIEALMALMACENRNGSIGPVNLGNPREISVLQLARRIKRLTQSNSTIIHMSALGEDPSRRQPDISKASQLLGWSPKTSLERGLELTLRELRIQKELQRRERAAAPKRNPFL